MRVLLVFAICSAALAGCSNYRDPGSQILVETEPPGAACVVSREGAPIAEINPTPAIALVSRSPAEIAIACRRPGFFDTGAVTRAHTAAIGPNRGEPEYDTPVRIRMLPR